MKKRTRNKKQKKKKSFTVASLFNIDRYTLKMATEKKKNEMK